METDDSQRASIEEDLAHGNLPSLEECRELLEDAARAEELGQELDALKDALGTINLQVIDTTTDEDEHRMLEIVSIEEP